MTLILIVASRHYVAQVSDRLLTWVNTKLPFDPASNKNLIYIALDANVSIGYSGIAYIDGLPTDQWIAHQLTGLTFPPTGETPRTYEGLREQVLDIGLSCEYLRRALDAWADSNRPLRSLAPQVVIGGWQFTRRSWRPIIWVLEYSQSDREYTVTRTASDYWWFRNRFYLVQVPEHSDLSRKSFHVLRVELRDCRDELSAEQALAAVIQSVAGPGSTVGPHCMSVLIGPPWENRIRVRYLPDEQVLGVEESSQDSASSTGEDGYLLHEGRPFYFTPWLVTPTLVVPPLRRVGMGSTYWCGDLSIQFESPEFQLPESPGQGTPTFDFGLIAPGQDDTWVSFGYSDSPEGKREIGHSWPQRRPDDPARRRPR